MRVLIEAAPLASRGGGVPRYTKELSLALARAFPEDEFVLASDHHFEMPSDPGGDMPRNLRKGAGPRNTMERRWWLWGLEQEAGRWNADIVHGPDFSVPYLPLRPSVLTLHDLSPWMDPAWHHAASRVRRRTPLLLKLSIPTMIITPGEKIRREAIARFGIRDERIVAVPESAPAWLRPVPASPLRSYFLFVGTLEPRKNLAALVEAWREVRRDCAVDLVIAGRRRADAPEIAEQDGLVLAGEVPDEKLAELYSGAVAFIYPSLYEGFGLPVIEAMQCGTGVIASSAVREACGEAAIYADTVAELARAMRRAATDPAWLAERRALSLARARQFSWERTAQLTYEVYLEARKRFGR